MHSLESVQKYEDEVQIVFAGILTLHITKLVSIREKLEMDWKDCCSLQVDIYWQRAFKKYTLYGGFLNLWGALSVHRITEFTI